LCRADSRNDGQVPKLAVVYSCRRELADVNLTCIGPPAQTVQCETSGSDLPWGPNRKAYEKHSPHKLAANLGKFRTPMLIIHNDNDFRCPIGQGLELFTTLNRLKVPARMINFPDEGHWVLKPKNSEYWHKEVFAWLEKHVKPGGQ
jgi:hypothetical protein